MEDLRSLFALASQWAASQPSAIALMADDGTQMSYAKLLDWIKQTANMLRARGVEVHDRVATVLPNGMEAAVAFLSVASCAIAVPINPRLRKDEFASLLTDVRASALLTDGTEGSSAEAAADELGIDRLEFPRLEGFASEGRSGQVAFDTIPSFEDIALILHTSGTTSIPKRVPLSHANLINSASNVARSLALSEQDCCLNPMPLFHIHGLVAGLLAPLFAGGSSICASSGRGDAMFAAIDRQKPTWYTAVPTIHQSLLTEIDRQGIDSLATSPLRLARSSSSAMPLQLLTMLEERLGVPVVEAYGMTEASHQIASNPLPPGMRPPGSVGLPVGLDIAVRGPQGEILGANEEGELMIRGASVTSGYEDNPEANSAVFVDGWFRTGDLGHIDENGYVYIASRLKEIINRGGEKVLPQEIDEALHKHPEVIKAIAFAIPHRTLGEDVAAAVVLRKGSHVSEADIRRFLFEQLADFKVPSRFVFLDDLPTGATGKPQRIGLAEVLADELREPFQPAASPIEQTLVQIWEEVLRVKDVGASDNFFMLGGDSLSTMRVLARVNEQYGISLTLRQAFESPRLEDLALRIELSIIEQIEGQDLAE